MTITANSETAILAGGCGWITQELMRHCEGPVSIRAGWSGGESDDPTEDEPGGHAEAVALVFDASEVSYRDALELFFQIHRPDLDEGVVGSMYRSEIFYTTDEQRQVAEDMIAHVHASGFWPNVATKISEAGPFNHYLAHLSSTALDEKQLQLTELAPSPRRPFAPFAR